MIQESFTPDGHSGDESTAVRGVCLQGDSADPAQAL